MDILKCFIFGFIGAATYGILLNSFLPPTTSCINSFTRKTIEDPAWAKNYWEKVASQKGKNHE